MGETKINTDAAATAFDDLVVIDREILGGEPVFRGTRVPLVSLFEHLESGCSLDEIFGKFSIGQPSSSGGNSTRGATTDPSENPWMSRPFK